MTSPVPLSLSHVGLYVRDAATMVAFYRDFMGFLETDRGALPHGDLVFLSRDPGDHHQLVLASGRPEGIPDRILNQLSFRVDSLADLKAFYERLLSAPVSDIDTLTHGIAWSVYFRDPEGNRVEVFADTPWYIHQPHRTAIDLTRPVDEIYEQTRALCESQPECRPFKSWQADLAERLAH
jgi:catechol 2,3-dioxygenase-like lactoylglutathione lyase family enzyme